MLNTCDDIGSESTARTVVEREFAFLLGKYVSMNPVYLCSYENLKLGC